MAEYVQTRTETGETLTFEVEEYDGPVQAGRRWDELVDGAGQAVDKGIEQVKAIAAQVATKVAHMPKRPDRVAVEMGIKVTGGLTVAVAKSSSEAHIKVTVEWTNPAESP